MKVPAKDEVKYIKKGNDVVKELTTYEVNPTNGTLTPTVLEEVVKKDGAKNTVVVTTIESPIRYEKDSTRLKGEANITEKGTTGTSTVTTTYEVNPEDGNLIPNVGQPVIVPATETVVKVPAKDEVKYIKKGNDVVKELTTYEVNPTNGTLTPTVTEEVVKEETLTPELSKNNKGLPEKTDGKMSVEVAEESKVDTDMAGKSRIKNEDFNPTTSEKELALPIFDYLLVHMVDKIDNVNSLRDAEKIEQEKTVIPFNNFIAKNSNNSLSIDNVLIAETIQVESVATKEGLEVQSTTSVETSIEGKNNSEVPNKKIKTEEVNHTESSSSKGIMIAEVAAMLAGIGVLAIALKRKKNKR